jgi:tetratricopeptide (TPR) repeat protein
MGMGKGTEPRSGLSLAAAGLLLAAALALEGKAGWELLHAPAEAGRLLPLGLLHLLACAMAGLFAAGNPAEPDSGRAIFAFVFSLALPVLGMAAVLGVVLPGLSRRQARKGAAFALIAAEDPEASGPGYSARYGPGGFRARLLSRRIPSASRLIPLMALGNRATPFGNRMMKEMLKDPADELRLMAYGTLERREMDFQKSMAEARTALRAAADDRRRLIWLRRLTFLQWEMVYQELVEGELSRFYLEQAAETGRQALEMEPMDGPLLMVYGRIQARLGAWDEALEALDGAERLGTPALRVVPHLAEVAFLRRDFAETRRLLNQTPELWQAGILRPLLRFWLENEP